MTTTVERRQTPGTLELRAGDGGVKRIGGYALKYRALSQNLGGFVEKVGPGAVTKSLADGGDVLARYQHDSNLLLGRTSAGTARLLSDDVGLDYEADLPDTSYARDLAALAARGDVRHSSFAFRVMPEGDEWSFTEMGFPLRTLTEIQLVDVAPVVSPAYLDTSSGLRSLAEHRGLPLDDVAKAAAANQLQVLMREHDPKTIDLKTKETGPPRDTHGLLSIRQRRAELQRRSTTL